MLYKLFICPTLHAVNNFCDLFLFSICGSSTNVVERGLYGLTVPQSAV